MPNELKIHPVADWLPELPESEYRELRDDIAKRGLREAILVKHGFIVDGRHRYKACIELGIEPRVEEYHGHDIIDEILSRNILRRHLSGDQRAMLVAKLRGDEESKKADARMKSGNPVSNSTQGRTWQPIAAEAKVSQHKARAALHVLKHKRDAADDVISGKRRLRDVETKKPKPAIPFEHQVVKRFQRFLDYWPHQKQREAKAIVREYCSP